MDLKIKFLHKDAKMPKYSSEEAAGLDFYTVNVKREFDKNGSRFYAHTGISVEIPKGYVGKIYPRSSVVKKTSLFLGNSVGIIDSDYRGEIIFAFRDVMGTGNIYRPGDKVGQMIIEPVLKINPILVEEIEDSIRGYGNFGSTDEI